MTAATPEPYHYQQAGWFTRNVFNKAVAGLIGPDTLVVTTVHELQVRAAGAIPLTSHDVPLDFIVTPDRVIECRRSGPRPAASIDWDDLTDEKIAAIPLLAAQRPLAQR